MEKNVPFAPAVLLIDAHYLDRVGKELSAHFAAELHRELPKADLAVLLECIALDGGVPGQSDKVDAYFIHDETKESMQFCSPSRFSDELHEVAFRGNLGEFSLYSFQPSRMAGRGELFIESMLLAAESDKVKQLILVPDIESYGSELPPYINKVKDKSRITISGMQPVGGLESVKFELLGFPILRSLGIRSDEL